MRLLIIVAFTLCFSVSYSQSKIKAKKYPSLMWEISGNGLKKPSYLFGTMHVSSKMAFHLSDSFYLGIRNAEVVALETDPGTWQDDFSRYDLEGNYYNNQGNNYNSPNDFLSINSLKAIPYEKLMGQALYSNPSIINSFLYRTNSEAGSDFEEDTYLDLYIFQVGKKWNKKVCGVENFDESMKLMKEAYADAAKDKNSKERSYDIEDQFSYAKLEEAYRTGNLDLLDTIHKLNSTSLAFDEKFLYKRNEIQANSMDSILKTGASLFVGVGAAHLPGERGVIEILRKMGYKLRPIKMTERDSRHKEELEKIQVPVYPRKEVAEDGFFSVNVPGKLYSFTRSYGLLNQQQYADMINGSYYMVSRIYTNAALWGHSTADVIRKVDSVLYENIPGKILSKESIIVNGYKGFDISNRTRRGDHQRYNIFITPFEIILFKVSGNGTYVQESKEAEEFFNSISLKEYKTEWKKYAPSFGGFEVDMPHQPIVNNAGNWQFLSYDASTKTGFQILRTDVYNTRFVEEDSFDLNLLEESFSSSEFIEKQLSRKHKKHQGYSALEVKYKYKDGSIAKVLFLIQGPHYYTLVANGRKENDDMNKFIGSFSIRPFVYKQPVQQVDTSLFFTVNTPVQLEKVKKLSMYPAEMYNYDRYSNEEEDDLEEKGAYKDKIVRSDSTGEMIYVSFYKPSRYYYDDDSSANIDTVSFKTPDQEWVYRSRKKYELPNKMRVLEYELGDPKSSRMIRGKSFVKDGVTYNIKTELDTLSTPSAFITEFFSSFNPSDTVKGVNVYQKKTDIFFADLFSEDSTSHKRAVRNIDMLEFDSTDFKNLKKAIASLTWQEKKYLDVKKSFIVSFSAVISREASDYLKTLYYNSGDTVDLQYAALGALLSQGTSYSYSVFRDIMVDEPPVLNVGSTNYNYNSYGFGSDFMDQLTDSLHLTKTILKDILPLININDYEESILDLLEVMADSSMVTAADYDLYYSKFLIEAKQLLKKQVIREKNKSINRAQKDPDEKEDYSYNNDEEKGSGNRQLSQYATLLMPFWEKNPAVKQLINNLLQSNDRRLKYNTMLLMLRNEKAVHDSVLRYFAAMDEYRYELFEDLNDLKMLKHFPEKYYTQMDIARSEIKNKRTYNAPDSFVFAEKLPLNYKGKDGFVYFFKYKQKKDDNSWKIATVGMIPSDSKKYSYDEDDNNSEKENFDFTQVTDTRLNTDEPDQEQFRKILKRMVYAKRKSAAQFYEDEENPFSAVINIRE